MANEAQGITAITVSGFKSLRDESRIEVRPLTILAGANSSGKSSIMQPLLLMKQTLEAPYDPGPLLLDGPNTQFTATDQFFLEGVGKMYQDFTIKLSLGSGAVLVNTFSKAGPDQQIELAEMTFESKKNKIRLHIDTTPSELIDQVSEEQAQDIRDALERNRKVRVVRERCFLDVDGVFPPIVSADYLFSKPILGIIHVPGLRRNPERTYKTAFGLGSMFQGTFENYVASIISNWWKNQDKRLELLERNLLALGLTAKVSAKPINDVQIELLVGRTLQSDWRDTVNIADVGFGVSQVLPVLVALLVAEPGQLVYIEQPELHLHPRAQVALAQVLADAANRGVRVVAETHSSLLLLGVQTLIAEGKLSPDNVMLHWFTRNEEGVTTIRSEEPDENGAYGDWPEDFDDVQLNAQKRYLDVVAEREMGMVNGNRETPGN